MAIDLIKIDEALTHLLDKKMIAGMAIAVTNSEKILFERGYGVTSVEKPWDKMSSKTLSRVASVTKYTVGLCAKELADQGKLDFDAPLAKYLPWFTIGDENVTNSITIRKLLNHTAGLPTVYTPNGFRDEDRSEKKLREQLAKIELIEDPDEGEFHYSNFGSRLVACAMEHIMCMNFSALCERFVLRPLGMEHSTFDICEAATYELALPHERGDGGELKLMHRIQYNATTYAAGGLYSSVHEMTALVREILKGDDNPALISKEINGKILLGHSGANPPYYSCIWADIVAGCGVSFVINTEGGAEFVEEIIPSLLVDSFY